ncbi:hypothetical protein HHK36_026775 [Tetracentron sinense]|uniref:Uncharacterized protein n=1 Tax=Tetracentron sinense TaxID=13715 RepID=A0A834YFM5_TETSI|nr:hypothetical protein HHK36_026775 [Tetracentron sinense]
MTDVKSGRVTVHSKLTAVSNSPVRPGKSYPLSVLDHAMGLHSLHVVFYFRQIESNDFDLGRLRESLSEVLTYYPVVTGRLKRGEDGNWEVKCNDAGVRVLNAKVSTTLDEWLRSADGSEERDLTVWDDMPEDPDIWSPFRIQINDFEGGGLAIGLSCTHMQADPLCATLIFKSWTDSYRGVAITHPPFFHPPGFRGRTSPITNTNSTKYYAAKSKLEPPSSAKMSTATFCFSDTMIKKCLSELHDQCPDATPYDLLAALFWSRVEHAKSLTHDRTNSLSICIDFRKLMQARFPFGFFGNALHFSLVSSDSREMDEGGLGYVVGLVNRHFSSLNEEEFWSAIDWFESQKGEGGKFAAPFRMYGPELTCINMEHMIIPSWPSWSTHVSTCQTLLYAAMFEKDKKPVHVSYQVGNVEGEGLILVLPSPEEGLGRSVMVTLPEDLTAKLCDDPAILRLEPTMLLSGRR